MQSCCFSARCYDVFVWVYCCLLSYFFLICNFPVFCWSLSCDLSRDDGVICVNCRVMMDGGCLVMISRWSYKWHILFHTCLSLSLSLSLSPTPSPSLSFFVAVESSSSAPLKVRSCKLYNQPTVSLSYALYRALSISTFS